MSPAEFSIDMNVIIWFCYYIILQPKYYMNVECYYALMLLVILELNEVNSNSYWYTLDKTKKEQFEFCRDKCKLMFLYQQ